MKNIPSRLERAALVLALMTALPWASQVRADNDVECFRYLAPRELLYIGGPMRTALIQYLADRLPSRDGRLAPNARATVRQLDTLDVARHVIAGYLIPLLDETARYRLPEQMNPKGFADFVAPLDVRANKGSLPTISFQEKYATLLETYDRIPALETTQDESLRSAVALAHEFGLNKQLVALARSSIFRGQFAVAQAAAILEPGLSLRMGSLFLSRFFEQAHDPEVPIASVLEYGHLAVKALSAIHTEAAADLLYDFGLQLKEPRFIRQVLLSRRRSVRNGNPLFNDPLVGVTLAAFDQATRKYLPRKHSTYADAARELRAVCERAMFDHIRPNFGEPIASAMLSTWNPDTDIPLAQRILRALIEKGDAETDPSEQDKFFGPAFVLSALLHRPRTQRLILARSPETARRIDHGFLGPLQLDPLAELVRKELSDLKVALQTMSDRQRDELQIRARTAFWSRYYLSSARYAARTLDLELLERATIALIQTGNEEGLFYSLLLTRIRIDQARTSITEN